MWKTKTNKQAKTKTKPKSIKPNKTTPLTSSRPHQFRGHIAIIWNKGVACIHVKIALLNVWEKALLNVIKLRENKTKQNGRPLLSRLLLLSSTRIQHFASD